MPENDDTGRFSSSRRLYVDWGKVLTIFTIVSSTVGLALARIIGPDAAMLILGSAAGYTFGNGRQAVAGRYPAPMIGAVGPAQQATVTPATDRVPDGTDDGG